MIAYRYIRASPCLSLAPPPPVPLALRHQRLAISCPDLSPLDDPQCFPLLRFRLCMELFAPDSTCSNCGACGYLCWPCIAISWWSWLRGLQIHHLRLERDDSSESNRRSCLRTSCCCLHEVTHTVVWLVSFTCLQWVKGRCLCSNICWERKLWQTCGCGTSEYARRSTSSTPKWFH